MVHEPKTRWAEAVPCSPSMFLAKKIVQYDNDNDNDKKTQRQIQSLVCLPCFWQRTLYKITMTNTQTKTNTVPCLPSIFLAKKMSTKNAQMITKE